MQKFYMKLDGSKPSKKQIVSVKKVIGSEAEIKEINSNFLEIQVKDKNKIKEILLGKAKTNKWSFVNL